MQARFLERQLFGKGQQLLAAASGGSVSANEPGDLLDVSDCGAATRGLGEKVERLIAVIADWRQRLIHIRSCGGTVRDSDRRQ